MARGERRVVHHLATRPRAEPEDFLPVFGIEVGAALERGPGVQEVVALAALGAADRPHAVPALLPGEGQEVELAHLAHPAMDEDPLSIVRGEGHWPEGSGLHLPHRNALEVPGHRPGLARRLSALL